MRGLPGGRPQTLIDRAPSTPAQKQNLLEVLLSSEELQYWRRTEKSGTLSTKRSELMRAGHYPPIMALVKLSRIDKALSSFGQTLAALVSPVTGRIHAHYRIAGTASGRASCSGPNLQQVPKDARFRALFVPEPGNFSSSRTTVRWKCGPPPTLPATSRCAKRSRTGSTCTGSPPRE